MATTEPEPEPPRKTDRPLYSKEDTQPKQYKQLTPPAEIIRANKPTQYLTQNYKLQLTTKTPDKRPAFVFVLSNKRPDILFLEYGEQVIRINKLLKQYTTAEETRAQFIELLKTPAIIQDRTTTNIILEIIYKMSIILNVPLKQYISDNDFKSLIIYYDVLYKINQHKRHTTQ